MTLRLHRFLPCTYANGPGCRAAVWFQGCSLRCPECFNPGTHPKHGGYAIQVTDLCRKVLDLGSSIRGVTLTGGEPLDQAEGLLAFLRLLRDTSSLSVVLLTGYTWPEIRARTASLPFPGDWLSLIDVVVAGRYQSRNHLAHGLRGSTNKTAHFLTDRYTEADLAAVPPAEVIISPVGQITATGVQPALPPRRSTRPSHLL